MKELFPAISAIALLAACSGEKAEAPVEAAQPAPVPPKVELAAAPTNLQLPLPTATSADIAVGAGLQADTLHLGGNPVG